MKLRLFLGSEKMISINYEDIINELKEEIKEVMEKEKIKGLAIALVDTDKIIWSEGFGFTDNSDTEKVTADTLFSTQSMGKTVCATTFMILASRGLINLDDPIRKYYPEFTLNTKFGDKDKEIEKITFRRMMSHTAGFTHEAPLGNNYDSTPCTYEEHIASIANTWLRSPVGSEYAYANIGFDLTAYVLGKIMDKSYPEVVKEELFIPLGIKTATLDVSEAQKHSFAKGTIGDFEPPVVQVPMLGAGGVYISVNEQAKFVMLHLNDGAVNYKQLISKENFDEMYKPQFEENGIKSNNSIGIFTENTTNGTKVFYHGGGGYGYATQHAWIPKHKIAAIVFTNASNHAGEQVKLARKALELMIKEKTKPESFAVDQKDLEKLVGTYFGYRKPMQNIILEDGELVCYDDYGKKVILYPQSHTEFTSEEKHQIEFIFDENKKVSGFKWKTNFAAATFKYNDGPNDIPGPNKKSWEKYTGIYEFYCYGVKGYHAIVINNGYLYLYTHEKYKLEEYQEDLFFTADGEVLYLGEKGSHYGFKPLTKTQLDIEGILEDCRNEEHERDKFATTFTYTTTILYWTKGFQEAFDFLSRAIEIDDRYKSNLKRFGNLLYGERKLENSLKCFEKVLLIDSDDQKTNEMKKIIEKELKH